MKFDLIIPAYNNKLGLYRSLFSLGTESHELIDVTVVDDASTEDYTSIIDFFKQFISIRLLKLPKNVGPGMARQYGLDHTNNPYVMFLDCGDYYISPDYIKMIIETVNNDPITNLFCWGHMRGSIENLGAHHNRMHGKIYKREFLNNHNIRFNPKGSYANEDVGFNMAVKMILRQYTAELNQPYIWYDNTPVLVWDNRDPSLTRADNHAFYYSIQNEALAINGGYALEIAQRERVGFNLRLHQIYEIMCDMYFKYLSTATARPEYIEQALNGARHFYWEHFRPIQQHDNNELMAMYYNTLVQYLADENDPIRKQFVTLDFIGFLNLLEEQKFTEN